MRERAIRRRPKPWQEVKQEASPSWTLFFRKLEWYMQWASWALGHWAFLEVVEHLGTFSVLIAVIFYFSESGDRIKQKHYQAWQVINTAQGRGGSGGRIEALQELNADKVSLTGVDAADAFLQGIHLENGELSRCNLHDADLRNSFLTLARLDFCNLQGANLRQSDLTGANLSDTSLQDADLADANLERANLAHANLNRADLRFAAARNIDWNQIDSMKLTNIYGMKNASSDFLAFAKSKGAVSLESDDDWNTLLQQNSPPPPTR